MKITFFLLIMFLIGCNGSGSSSDSSNSITIDSRFNGAWVGNYLSGGSSWVDELSIVGDDVSRSLTQYTGGVVGGPYDDQFVLIPLTGSRIQANKVGSEDLIIWKYAFSNGGNTMVLCDTEEFCVTYDRQ